MDVDGKAVKEEEEVGAKTAKLAKEDSTMAKRPRFEVKKVVKLDLKSIPNIYI